MIRHQSVQSLAFLQAEWISMLTDCIAALTPSARWYVGIHKVSSSDWAVGTMPNNLTIHIIIFHATSILMPSVLWRCWFGGKKGIL